MEQILVAVDFSDITETVIHTATKLALDLDASLCIVHTEIPEPDFVGFEAGPQVVRDQVAHEISRHMHKLDEIHARIEHLGLQVKCLDMQGDAVDVIIKEAKRFHADLIVLGAHEHGALYHLVFGSIREDLIKHAPCPVLIVPAHSD